jgi:lipoyl-dependent peroxiredoxin
LGTRQRGKGAINSPTAALKMALFATDGDRKRCGTCPPELVAAALAGSFSLTLANELGEAGYKPRQIDTLATVTMENIGLGWTLTQIHLDVTAGVPRVAECGFVDAALQAKANCPISRALNANISMRARLSPPDADGRPKSGPTFDLPRPGAARKSAAKRKLASVERAPARMSAKADCRSFKGINPRRKDPAVRV